MNNKIVIMLIILALVVGALAGHYYALTKVEAEPVSEEVLEQVNPFEYVNPFE